MFRTLFFIVTAAILTAFSVIDDSSKVSCQDTCESNRFKSLERASSLPFLNRKHAKNFEAPTDFKQQSQQVPQLSLPEANENINALPVHQFGLLNGNKEPKQDSSKTMFALEILAELLYNVRKLNKSINPAYDNNNNTSSNSKKNKNKVSLKQNDNSESSVQTNAFQQLVEDLITAIEANQTQETRDISEQLHELLDYLQGWLTTTTSSANVEQSGATNNNGNIATSIPATNGGTERAIEKGAEGLVSILASINCPALFSQIPGITNYNSNNAKLLPRFLLFNEHFVDVPFELKQSMFEVIQNSDNDYKDKMREEFLKMSKFDPSRETIVLIHGYLGGYATIDGLTNIKNRLVDAATTNFSHQRQQQRLSYNVIYVDWFEGANPAIRSSYIHAALNSRIVGKYIASFLTSLTKGLKFPAKRVHILAHSLGCHVAGFTGKEMLKLGGNLPARNNNNALGRITHLDPVGLCFGKLFTSNSGNTSNLRLSPNDAVLTEAVHVARNLFDNPLDGASSNFLVSGGKNQADCGGFLSELKNTTLGVAELTLLELWDNSKVKFTPCSHVRALSLFEDDHNNNCQFVGYKCNSYESFLAGNCGICDESNSQCKLMSLPNNLNSKLRTDIVEKTELKAGIEGDNYYLGTSNLAPYCVNYYQVRFFLKNGDVGKKQYVQFYVKVLNEKGSFFKGFSLNYKIATLKQDNSMILNFLLNTTTSNNSKPEKLTKVVLSYFSADSFVPVNRIEINYMSNISPEIRQMYSSRLRLRSFDSNHRIMTFAATERQAVQASNDKTGTKGAKRANEWVI